MCGQMMLADHHLDVDSEGVGIAEDLDDAAARGSIGGREVGDLDIDDDTLEIAEVDGLGCSGFFAEDAIGFDFGGFAGNFHPSGMMIGWVMRSSKGVTVFSGKRWFLA